MISAELEKLSTTESEFWIDFLATRRRFSKKKKPSGFFNPAPPYHQTHTARGRWAGRSHTPFHPEAATGPWLSDPAPPLRGPAQRALCFARPLRGAASASCSRACSNEDFPHSLIALPAVRPCVSLLPPPTPPLSDPPLGALPSPPFAA
jgi:hypothetical protein